MRDIERAKLIGISRGHLSNLRSGRREVSKAVGLKLAKLTCLSLDDVFTTDAASVIDQIKEVKRND